MCCCDKKKQGCQKPEDLKDKPQGCPPEQICRCHGDAKKHPCLPAGSRKEARV